jgi:DNA-binding LacI/PurR family transcriptional regulator
VSGLVIHSLHTTFLTRNKRPKKMAKRKRSPSSKIPKMTDIARIAGVNVSTVSRALSGNSRVGIEQRERILKLARERGYVVNPNASNLRTRRTQTLSVVIPLRHETGQALSDPFFVSMLGYLADEITQRGYGMFLKKVLPPMKNWLQLLIESQRADGIIVIGQSTEHSALEAAAKSYRPLVVWGGHLHHQSYCTVGSDNVGGARAAVEHLIQGGRKRIVFMGDSKIPEMRLRHDGYLLALEQGARGSAEDLQVPSHMTADTAYEAMRAFIRDSAKFDAVFAASDVMAISAIRAIIASGLSVPKDVAVVGFDDIAMAAYANPPLTTVRQDLQHGAKVLVDLVLRRIEGEDTPSATMPAELIVRESSTARRR